MCQILWRCTKGSKVHSEVGNDPKSLCYGFLNEIMTYPCSDGGPGSTKLGCTKFHEVIPNFVKNVWSERAFRNRDRPQSLTYGFLNEIVDHPCVGNSTEFPTWWETKIIEKTHAKEKQSHAQDNIYVVWQFAHVHGVVGISLLSEKNTEYYQ